MRRSITSLAFLALSAAAATAHPGHLDAAGHGHDDIAEIGGGLLLAAMVLAAAAVIWRMSRGR